MPLLDDIYRQILPGRVYQFAFGPKGFAVARLEANPLFVAYEVLSSGLALPYDAGLVERDDHEAIWFGGLELFESGYGIPRPGQRPITVEAATFGFPNIRHGERMRR